MTEFVALATFFSGSADSAAAMVTISAPMKARMTTAIAEAIETMPLGAKPPSAVRLLTSAEVPGHRPST